MILALYMRDFMIFSGEHHIEFNEKSNLIVGKNEYLAGNGGNFSGKTSILRAIAWVFTGLIPGESAERTTKGLIIPRDSKDVESVVSVTLTHGDSVVVITRSSLTSNGVKVEVDGIPLADSQAYINNLIGSTPIRFFRQLFFSPDSPLLVDETTSEIVALLSEIVDVTLLDKILEDIRDITDTINRQIHQAEGAVTALRPRVQQQAKQKANYPYTKADQDALVNAIRQAVSQEEHVRASITEQKQVKGQQERLTREVISVGACPTCLRSVDVLTQTRMRETANTVIKTADQKLSELQAMLQHITQQREAAEMKRKVVDEALAYNAAMTTANEADAVQLQEAQASLNKMQEKLATAKELPGATKLIRDAAFQSVFKQIISNVCSVLSDLNSQYTVEITATQRGVSFIYKMDIIDKNSVKKKVAWSTLSGGERTEIKLAFLLALQRVAGNPLQVILMDEPFALLSEEMQQNILLYLAECGYQLIFTSNSQDHVADQVIRVTRIGEYRATVA